MFGSELLDVAIGMVFVFLLLSLICSALNELLETALRNRAGDLATGIKELLGKDTGLVEKLYNHGLIFALYRGTYEEALKKKTLPSYIPSKDFATAVAGILGPDSGAIPSADDIRNSINKIQNVHVKSALFTLFTNANNDLEAFRKGIEGWFNSAMDRVSGWYKRRTHIIIFVLGFVIAVAMNVNSISLAQDLWISKAKRDALIGSVQGYLQNHPAPAPSGQPPAAGQNSAANLSLDPALQVNIDQLQKAGIVIGWKEDLYNSLRNSPKLLLAALLGWFLTASAASLGAPFWFDLLSKIVVLRSSITPGQKSAPPASK